MKYIKESINGDLLEVIKQKLHCTYISDLRNEPTNSYAREQFKKMNLKKYSLKVLNDACRYIYCYNDDDRVFENKKICQSCKTGKYFYELDPKSDTCPYIACWEQNKCPFYKPLDKTSKNGFFRRLINKKSPTLTKK